MVANKKSGNLTIPLGLNLEDHEILTGKFLAKHGEDVEFLMPSRRRNSRNPDLLLRGQRWEVKSPIGNSKTTISNALKRAVKQSSYIILDSRRTKLSDEVILTEVRRNIQLTRSMKKVLVITKSGSLVEIHR